METAKCIDKCNRGITCQARYTDAGVVIPERIMTNPKTGISIEVTGFLTQCPDNSDNTFIDPERAGTIEKANARAYEFTLNPIMATEESRQTVLEIPPSNHVRPSA